ncbi:MAG: molybdopterin-dependent oxidoreductase [Coriobacteriales bacterium]|jgi:anaerobic selenocysteine-containing dehydrogenase|nr:molybdopterin-dependent oxidoreductase [Coriobacteriales bacterium]
MADYKEFLNNLNRKAYHEGEVSWEEDGLIVTRTYNYTAPGCHDSCGVLLYINKDGQLVKVEGDPLDPYANGKLCMRCLNLPEATNNEYRIKTPLKRERKYRGDASKFVAITWDEAIDIVESKIKELVDDAGLGRESIIVGHGTGRNINWQVPFIAGACFRTANVGGIYFSGWSCYMPRVCGAAGPMGDYPLVDASQTFPDRYANPEWQPPEVLVIWGVEPNISNADGYLGHWLTYCVQQGTKIITIDPQLTWWAARSEYWLPVNSGTDVCIALAWLNVIIYENLIDHEFVDLWCAYYDELKEHVKDFTPKWAASITGLSADDIANSARLYASASRGAIQWGLAFDASTASSMHWVLAVCDIMAICGHVEKPGTHVFARNSFDINAGYSSVDLYADPKAYKKKFSKAMAGFEGLDFVGMSNPDAMAKTLETGEPFPIKILWAQSCNAFAGHEEPGPRAYKYMKEIEFIAYADPFMTPTIVALADLVVPVAMSCERDSARTWWTPLRAMKKVSSFYEAKSDEEIALWLGKRLNPALFERWETAEDLINDYLLTDLAVISEDGTVKKSNFSAATDDKWGHDSGADDTTVTTKCPVTFQQLVEGGKTLSGIDALAPTSCAKGPGYLYDSWNATYFKHEKGLLRPDGSKGFNTPSGRIELIPTTFDAWGIPKLPIYTPVSCSQETKDEFVRYLKERPAGIFSTTGNLVEKDFDLFEEYPFYFINGARSYEFFHTEHRWAKTMREFHPEPLVKISPETAVEYNLKDGDWVWIENWDGRCKQMVKVFKGMPKKAISAEHGWWKPEEEANEPSLYKAFDYNVNNLTRAYESGPGNIGAPIKCLRAKIYKVTEENATPTPGEQVTRLGGFRTYEPAKP